MKHIKTVNKADLHKTLKSGGCGECQASCQSACKTSCTVGNQVCERQKKQSNFWESETMDKEKLAALIGEKIDAALKANDTPKKFFITENGRGVVDGGDLYNAVLNEVVSVMKVALTDIISEVVAGGGKTSVKEAAETAVNVAKKVSKK